MSTAKQFDEAEDLAPDLSHLITEDDTPVDNRQSERQMRLLSDPLFESWEQGKPFEALTDVGLFYKPDNQHVVAPDFLLSLEVEPRELTSETVNKSYHTWVYGKPPNLVVEIVSNKVGGELDHKLEVYRKIGVSYYAVFDPFCYLGERVLRLFQIEGGQYVEMLDPYKMPGIGLGFTLWEGSFHDAEFRWLRFVDAEGNLLLTGGEKAREAEERGVEKGLEQGMAIRTQELAKGMLEGGIEAEKVSELTGLSLEELKAL